MNKLQKDINNIYETVEQSVNWLKKNNNNNPSLVNDLSLLKYHKMKIRKIQDSVMSKPVFAVFGVSQVGKSYLIKNLLSVNGKDFEIKINDKKYDFLKDINPTGGVESTGVVTRFTIDHVSNNTNFPIRSKLFSISDLIIILTDSYLNDIKNKENELNESDISKIKDDFNDKIKYYQKHTGSQEFFSDIDIIEIKEFLTKSFKQNEKIKILQKINYWDQLEKIISKVQPKDWIDLLSILWGNNESFNLLFQKLITFLEEIKFQKTVYLQDKAILSEEDAILDVKRIKDIDNSNNKNTIIYFNDREVKVNTNILSALSSEITLKISEDLLKTKPFLSKTDLLDFPGSRSRITVNLNKVQENTPKMFLRAKISYLFQKYSNNFEINNLLFCLKDEQIEVKEIPELINEWISKNIGENIDERTKTIKDLKISPLFIIFTFFNNQLELIKHKDEKEDLSYRWDNRFNTIFKNELVTNNYEWDDEWTKENKFNNFYLLRDFHYSNDTFTGFTENKQEKEINPERIDFLKKLKNSFLNHEFVNKHFVEKEKKWDQACSVNSDGSQHIIKNLLKSAHNNVKINKIKIESKKIISDSIERLTKHLHEDNNENEVKILKKESKELILKTEEFIDLSPLNFAKFIKKILLTDIEVHNIYHEHIGGTNKSENTNNPSKSQKEKIHVLINKYPGVSLENTIHENIDIIIEKSGYPEEWIKNNYGESLKIMSTLNKNEDQNEIDLILEDVIIKWENKIKNTQDFSEELKYLITSIMSKTFKKLEIKKIIKKSIEERFNKIKIEREDEHFCSSMTKIIINEFMVNFGFNHIPEKELEKIKKNLTEKQINDLEKTSFHNNDIKEKELTKVFENFKTNDIVNFNNNFQNWKIKMEASIINNQGVKNYDEKQNHKLKEILGNFKSIKID